jgi:hypothetical protein
MERTYIKKIRFFVNFINSCVEEAMCKKCSHLVFASCVVVLASGVDEFFLCKCLFMKTTMIIVSLV